MWESSCAAAPRIPLSQWSPRSPPPVRRSSIWQLTRILICTGLIPAPTNTPKDAGPYITMGMCYATHPDTGLSDVTIHRMCIQSRDELSIFLMPGARHIGAMAERATELGRPLPISISIGVDPAIEIGSCFEPPTTPMGFNELSIAGAIRNTPGGAAQMHLH